MSFFRNRVQHADAFTTAIIWGVISVIFIVATWMENGLGSLSIPVVFSFIGLASGWAMGELKAGNLVLQTENDEEPAIA